ncbi:MAG: DUF418 domain-containing protein [Phycisphaerales bacterium]|nr:DUF418 domain-containing protein [Phycisphaerales bacterium]
MARPLNDDHAISAAPVAQARRIESLDVLRGLAVLGILAMNVMTFAMPIAAYSNPTVFPAPGPLNTWTYRVVHALFDLKMMALFSMLFGAGLVVWSRKEAEQRRPGALRWLWMRRMAWLLVIGMIHAWWVWEGDILVSYAVCGMLVLWWFRRLEPAWLLAAAGAFFAIHLLFQVWSAWFAVQLFAEPSPWAGVMSAAELEQSREGMRLWMDPSPGQIDSQIAALRGSWLDTFRYRAEGCRMLQFQAIPYYLFWRSSALMLLGAALTKLRILTGERPARFYGAMALAGYGVGLPLVALGIAYNESHGFRIVPYLAVGNWANTIGSVPVALGHAGLVLWVLKRGWLRRAATALARVGQMALTNYLMQSVLCSLIFYGFGLGLAGEVSRPGQEAIVAGIWIVEILWRSNGPGEA